MNSEPGGGTLTQQTQAHTYQVLLLCSAADITFTGREVDEFLCSALLSYLMVVL